MNYFIAVFLIFTVSLVNAEVNDYCPELHEYQSYMKVISQNISKAGVIYEIGKEPQFNLESICSYKDCKDLEKSKFTIIYLPDHPLANHEGYAKKYDIDLIEEMELMVENVKNYEGAVQLCME